MKPDERRFGVIGDPIEHSLSPALFAGFFERFKLHDRCRYEAFRVRAEELLQFVAWARRELAGFNVTIPHKERITAHLDGLDPTARALGAVNVVANRSGELWGFNTDVAGFLAPLRARKLDGALRGKRAVVLGAGGAARAVVFALQALGVREVVLANRTRERAARLARWAQDQAHGLTVTPVALEGGALKDALSGAALLVNATPVGMWPRVDASPLPPKALEGLHEGLIVYDLVYNPRETRLLREARARGAVVVDGLGMLVAQALEALKIWLPELVDVDEEALKRALQRHL